MSRSYYAVYSVTTGELVKKKVMFRQGMKNPPHEALPMLIRTHLTSLSVHDRHRLGRLVSRMIVSRIDADYRPGRSVDVTTAVYNLTNAADALRLMGAL